MVSLEPKVALNGRYTIQQTCKLLGIHHNTLARYVKRGRISYGVRESTGRKFYLGSEILRFWKKEM